MDPFQALAKLVLGKLEQSLIGQWLKFLFELAFSGLVSYLFICGGALAGGTGSLASEGLGMVAAAISLTYLFRRERSKLTRGMIIALPESEAAKELESNMQTIIKSDK
jgi:hypothetical protein